MTSFFPPSTAFHCVAQAVLQLMKILLPRPPGITGLCDQASLACGFPVMWLQEPAIFEVPYVYFALTFCK